MNEKCYFCLEREGRHQTGCPLFGVDELQAAKNALCEAALEVNLSTPHSLLCLCFFCERRREFRKLKDTREHGARLEQGK